MIDYIITATTTHTRNTINTTQYSINCHQRQQPQKDNTTKNSIKSIIARQNTTDNTTQQYTIVNAINTTKHNN